MSKKKISIITMVSSLVLLIVIIFIANIFWSVYIVLTLLSSLIIIASFFVANTVWGKKTTFEKGDIIIQSAFYKSKELAEKDYKKAVKKLEVTSKGKINSEMLREEDQYYFEIYALDKITLDSDKGELVDYETI